MCVCAYVRMYVCLVLWLLIGVDPILVVGVVAAVETVTGCHDRIVIVSGCGPKQASGRERETVHRVLSSSFGTLRATGRTGSLLTGR
jgi:hypothetical protein